MAASYGFDHVTIMRVPAAGDLFAAPLVSETTLPDPFLILFDDHRCLTQCPISRKSIQSSVPFSWSLDDGNDHVSPEDFPPDVQRVLRDYGIVAGFCVPLHSLDGTRFVMHFAGRRHPPPEALLNELCVNAHYAFDVFDRLRRAERTPSHNLSARELEVMKWTSHGKTSVEIARILSLSDHTVNSYLTSAIRKMDCVNRTQLVAKALRMRLIS